jgi:hypothetical protein
MKSGAFLTNLIFVVYLQQVARVMNRKFVQEN